MSVRQGELGGQTFPEAMAARAASSPDVLARFHGARGVVERTIGELHTHSRRVAARLQQFGISPGDVIAIQVPNWVEGAVAYQATLLAGATVVPIVHIYGPEEVGFILRQSGARMLVVPDRWRSTDYLERLDRLDRPDVLEHVVAIGEEAPAGCLSWDELQGDASALVEPDVRPDDVCLLVYTSGTTADPKGVQHTHRGMLAELDSMRRLHDHPLGAPRLLTFPFGHMAGVLGLNRLMVQGTPKVVMDTWDAPTAAMLIEEHGIAETAGTPYHLATLLDAADAGGHDLHSLTDYHVGAASVPSALVERADRYGIAAYRAYGSTEQPTISCGVASDPLEKRADTDGGLTPGTEVRIVDASGRAVPAGHDGEILCRGPELFIGYRDGRLDADAFVDGRWFQTGDLGRIDEDGYLTVTGRIKDVVIRGGETISASQVEAVLSMHPAVAEVAVVASPDERMGEQVCAFVTVRPGYRLALDDVRAHFAESGVARQKTPERLELLDELPRTASGKVQKFRLRERLA